MKILVSVFFLFALFPLLASCTPAPKRDYNGNVIMTGKEVEALRYNHQKSLDFLDEARDYRSSGRYELARQSYVQALSICSDGPTLNIIKRELEGINLLLRTMR